MCVIRSAGHWALFPSCTTERGSRQQQQTSQLTGALNAVRLTPRTRSCPAHRLGSTGACDLLQTVPCPSR